jgi:lysophospholipid acyltransferase (LPLAT)-like uncharacterized protein
LNDKPDWPTSTWRRVQISVIAGLGYPLVNLLGRTLRWQVDGVQHLDALAASGRQPVLGFWHGRILPATYYFRRRGIVVITSENFDGEWIARIIERFGYGTARGSTSRGARRALLQMKRVLEAGKAVAFTLDGPRGPARRAQAGAVWLAGATENPLVPFHIEAERHWTLGSWDRTQIPQPFTTAALAIGAPIPVPRDPDDAVIERKREELEQSLGLLEIKAKQMLEEEQ